MGFFSRVHPAISPAVREDFMAFAVAYLPSELSSVLGVLLLGIVGPNAGGAFWVETTTSGLFKSTRTPKTNIF